MTDEFVDEDFKLSHNATFRVGYNTKSSIIPTVGTGFLNTLFANAALWSLVVLPLAGLIIYSLYREDVQASFDGQLKKLVTAIAIDSIADAWIVPVAPTNRYEPLFEVTHSGWYWQIKPLDDPNKATLVSPSLATTRLPSPFERKFPSDSTGTRWMNVDGPNNEPTRIVELVSALGKEGDDGRYSIIVAGPLDWLEALVTNFQYRLAIALTLAGLGLLAVTLFQVRFGLLPLKRVEQGAEIRWADAARESTGAADRRSNLPSRFPA